MAKARMLHKKISVSREDFFTATVGTKELSIVCSSNMEKKIIEHFNIKPKFIGHSLSAIGISFKEEQLSTPNIIFSLISVLAKERINIAEIVSTYTELIFIVAEKDFSRTVSLFSGMHK